MGAGLVARSARNLTRGTTLASDVEVAGSVWARFWGLMGRPVLLPGQGLWLPSDNGIHMFFMRFAIDAVFLGKSGATAGATAAQPGAAPGARPIVGLSRGLRPWIGLVPFVRGADGVLELPVGSIAASGSELGDLVSIG